MLRTCPSQYFSRSLIAFLQKTIAIRMKPAFSTSVCSTCNSMRPKPSLNEALPCCYASSTQPAEFKGAGTHQPAHSSETCPFPHSSLDCLSLQITLFHWSILNRYFFFKVSDSLRQLKAHLVWFIHVFNSYANKTASLLHCLN